MRISRLEPESDVAKLTILTKAGFVRLNNFEWLTYDTLVTLKEGYGSMKIKLYIPEGSEEVVNNLEELLLLKSDDKKAFLRIRIIQGKGVKEK